jgi:hypothetical protein
MHTRAGRLSISPELAELIHLCERCGEPMPSAPSLALAKVQRIEAELECALPDDVLAVLATRAPMLRTATGLAFDELLDVHDGWADGVPDTHVAIAYVYGEPFAERFEGAHGGPYDVLAIPREGPVTRTEVLVLTDGRLPDAPTTLAAFATEKIEAWYQSGTRSGDATRFEPRLVGEPAPTATLRERWVTHPKLGRGRLLEVRDDKWVVAFEAGTKTLKSSMCVADPEPTEAKSTPRARSRVETAPDHPQWSEFAARLQKAGVDPLRSFYEQADASKGTDADGWAYRMRDADARVRTTLRIVRELTGRKLPATLSWDDTESEAWTSPIECFRAGTR